MFDFEVEHCSDIFFLKLAITLGRGNVHRA